MKKINTITYLFLTSVFGYSGFYFGAKEKNVDVTVTKEPIPVAIEAPAATTSEMFAIPAPVATPKPVKKPVAKKPASKPVTQPVVATPAPTPAPVPEPTPAPTTKVS